jgi:hypothetical protein
MRFWLRELAGWVLVVLGLYVFYGCYVLLLNHYLVEAGPLVLIGIVIFRGGIHLLKVAVAARVCLHARELSGGPPPIPRTRTRSSSAPR